MASERLIAGEGHRYFKMESEPTTSTHMMSPSLFSFNQNGPEPTRIFDELPKATIVHVSRPDAGDISPMLLSYTIELQYKEFKWQLHKKAAQVLYLHFALKKRVFIEEIQEKQEQVKEWLQNIGIGDHAAVLPEDDEGEDETVPLQPDEIAKNRDVPSSAVLPVIRPALGRQHSISDRAKVTMQGYLNHFLGNLDIVNSREPFSLGQPHFNPGDLYHGNSSLAAPIGSLVALSSLKAVLSLLMVCKFLEVSKLSFSPEYGPKLKEDYVMVKHLPKIPRDDDHGKCCLCHLFSWCNDNWQKADGGFDAV
ncbi:hypothetical protein Dimus_029473 [Dionaea muscipula]